MMFFNEMLIYGSFSPTSLSQLENANRNQQKPKSWLKLPLKPKTVTITTITNHSQTSTFGHLVLRRYADRW